MKKIYFILLIVIAARMFHVTFPVMGWHSWRQSDTATITRNFYENGHNILYPQINWAPQTTGFVESEFHIYPFIVSLLYNVFGVNDMVGRLVSILFSLLAVYGLYLLVRKFITEQTALWSALIYGILPLNIFYGRAFMPESTLLMCSISSVYFFSEWIDKGGMKYFFFAWLFTSLAVLIKLPTLYIGLPLAFLAFQRYSFAVFRKAQIYLMVLLTILPAALWYYHAHQLLLNGGASFGIWTYGQDKWGMFSLLADPAWYNDIFFKNIAERHTTYAGFILMVWGLFIKRTEPKEKLFDFWLIGMLVYIFIAAQAHRAQEYYTLPIAIPAAVFIAKIFARYLPMENLKAVFNRNKFASTFAAVCLLLICVLSYLRMANFMKSETWDSPVLKIGKDVQSVSQKNDLILTVSNGNPVYLYHAHRNGWNVMPEQLDSAFITTRFIGGAKYLAGEKNMFNTANSQDKLNYILTNYVIVKNEPDYFVVILWKKRANISPVW